MEAYFSPSFFPITEEILYIKSFPTASAENLEKEVAPDLLQGC